MVTGLQSSNLRMMRKALLLIAPLLLLASIELAFRFDLWEPMASPTSHAGTSVRLKRELLAPNNAKIDFVTLGSSLPEFGIDHESVAAAARQHGFVHANLSMPGVHWMSIGILTDWLRQHHPEIRGGVIALSVQDLAWPGNGHYELGIVQPFRQPSDTDWIEAHIPLDRSQMETWGSRFALIAWRSDVRDFLAHPFKRLNRLRKSLRDNDSDRLFSNRNIPGDMCAWGLKSLDACVRLDADSNASDNLRRQCREIAMIVNEHPDFAAMARQGALPESMQKTRNLVRNQLREIKWRTPPIVLLMPTPTIWRADVRGAGLEQWALSVLKPLDQDGTIRLIDATTFFDIDKEGGCSDFGDFYHQNSKGRSKFSEWLLPRIDRLLYSPL